VVQGAFALVARLRSAPALHPRGTVLAARLVLDPGSLVGAALGAPAERPVLVRASKAVGTPGAAPDMLGMALRVPAGAGAVDLLMTTSVGGGPAQLLLVPTRWWTARPFSTLMPYRVRGRLVVLGLDAREVPGPIPADTAALAAAVRRGPVALTLTEMPLGGRRLTGPRRPIGRLVLESVAAGERPIAFDSVLNSRPDLHPARPLRVLRKWAYTGSRRGRRVEVPALARRP
jgi:hypothetical protein